MEAERKAKEDWREEQRQARLTETNQFREWQKEHKRLRQEAIAEGRHHISEMTPAEQEARRLDAEKAHNDERAALSFGIDKLAGKYWGMEGQGAEQDRLDKAMQVLVEEQNRAAEVEAEVVLDLVDGGFDMPPAPAAETNEPAPPLPPTEQEEAAAATAAAFSPLDAMEVLEAARKMEELSLEEQEAKRREEEAIRQEKLEEQERQQRVAESLQMYKQQLEAERKGGATTSSLPRM